MCTQHLRKELIIHMGAPGISRGGGEGGEGGGGGQDRERGRHLTMFLVILNLLL